MTETQLIERAFQELINDKHLYQSVEIDFEPAIRETARRMYAASLSNPRSSHNAQDWSSEESIKQKLLAEANAKEWVIPIDRYGRYQIPFSIPPVKTLCSVCDDVTPFNPWSNTSARPQAILLRQARQLFYLPLECQGCRSNVIVFMVSRNDRKIQLVGRSEFERVKAPPSIPKEQRTFYSQAVIAFNCGQILAALFLLRTLVEQHMRAVTKAPADIRGEDLGDEYNKTLDADLKARFPSFKDVYGKLSGALHKAESNASLFESEIERIRLHFEGFDLFAKVHNAKRQR